ncbi:MAG: flagellar hook protein FlgE [Syntrophomonadaceae bacterium]|jgi:flagellar hook protein FlgE|nr:flagellar hook protein FlgE [Syntrophomonadaceae bacterium]
MMRSLYSGVTGLKNQQVKMDVIGNNIANVGTAGFKKSRVVFSDKLYQANRGASAPSDTRGGTNPMSVGLGTALFSIDQIHTPYAASMTNRLTDMALDGDGYFIVKQSSGSTVYTRSGAFVIDEYNNLVTVNGDFVQGWLADEDGNFITNPTRMTNINITDYQNMAPKATTEMIMEGNLNSALEAQAAGFNMATDAPDDENVVIIAKDFYDSLGNKNTLSYRFFKTGANEWACDLSLDPTFPDNGGTGYTSVTPPAAANFTDAGGETFRIENIIFGTDGKIDSAGVTSMHVTFDNTAVSGADIVDFTIDLEDILQYNSDSNIDVGRQNGNSAGVLVSRDVGTDGIMNGTYDNGFTRPMFQIAIASFKNAEGLKQIGNSSWQESANSGDPQIGVPGSGSRGSIMPGYLEMSNVDMAEEFTEMIVTQRGFSANSRIITVSDEMLQELVNIKR